MPVAVGASVFCPYYTTIAKGWFYDGVPEAGVTHVNSPAHPFAGALGETIIKFDGNSGTHVAKPFQFGPGATDATTYQGFLGDAPPDSTGRRWGVRRGGLFRFTGTPTSAAQIFGTAIPAGLFLNTDLTIKWIVSGVTYTSLIVLAADTWYWLDMWDIWSAGATINTGTHQLCVRISTLSAGAQGTITTLINVLVTGATGLGALSVGGSGLSLPYGEDNARGAGFAFFLGNVYSAWEDADDPYGVIRVDRLDRNANESAKNKAWTTVGNANNRTSDQVRESGTAEPDDGTTFDSVAIVGGGTKDETYTGSATVITGSDRIIRPVEAIRETDLQQPGKGEYVRIIALESDGTNNQLGANQTSQTLGTFGSFYQGWDKNPAGGAWTVATLNTLETGNRADTNAAGTQTYHTSTITTLVAYQAAGETLPAVPTLGNRRRGGVF